ncbi:YihY/virulence factor BrkB family protein [Rhizobium sp. PL01]|uniref:YihY/virulence factor BrkB family protein n=1 Tax=Rhizobium sp. PL01 TaxID=3085631 RepID=UPI00298246B8|nr:YihY/virulence factor BrkB family protein [Rhizobium sp. PL01]MDW5318480.1 YihY/virulence factor BrkB family protein [Rhizobium sp. PL01]
MSVTSAVLLIISAIGAATSVMVAANKGVEPNQDNTEVSIWPPHDDERGRYALTPEAIPAKGLRDVFWRVVSEVSKDRVTLIAAGVTYYLLLALFPALAALVSLYGFIADPTEIGRHLVSISGFLPPGSFNLILDQLKSLTEQKTSSLSSGFFGGLAIALWSAHNGTMALFDAMNIAYEEREKRSVIKLNIVAVGFTLGALLIAAFLVAAVAVMPVVLSFLWLDRWTEILALLLRWPILLIIVMAGVTAIYRFAPSRSPARLRWINWGAAFTTASWSATSLIFSYYIDHFANYNATYGTLGALIGFMAWMWISVVILIVGAELNAELEHQTIRDTTTGTPKPMGSRGAFVADTLGREVK